MFKSILFLMVILNICARSQEKRFVLGAKRIIANNLKLIDKDFRSGFAIYRIGLPTKRDMKLMCKEGIEEMYVLSGNAVDAELKLQNYCPSLKVVYDHKQDVHEPLDKNFLDQFDSWVLNAKTHGKKIAFRCDCGCHRTGRLAAYYEMKFMSMNPIIAIKNMMKIGKMMFLYPFLDKQVFALHDYIEKKSCSQDKPYCVKN